MALLLLLLTSYACPVGGKTLRTGSAWKAQDLRTLVTALRKQDFRLSDEAAVVLEVDRTVSVVADALGQLHSALQDESNRAPEHRRA
jgi:hypothetical protein